MDRADDGVLYDVLGTGHARALEEVACVAGKHRESELVRTAARVAMIADERLDPGEARVLEEINKILG